MVDLKELSRTGGYVNAHKAMVMAEEMSKTKMKLPKSKVKKSKKG